MNRVIILTFVVLIFVGCKSDYEKCSMDYQVPACLSLLKSDDAATRSAGLMGIEQAGADKADAAVLNAVVESLQDPAAEVRAIAARTLGAMGPAAKPFAKALVPLMADKSNFVKEEATKASAALSK